MGVLNHETREIHAKIVLYGPPEAGTTTNLSFIHRKLKKEHRGELRTLGAEWGAKGAYEFLPVNLGPVRGYQTSIHLYTVPAGKAHAAVRRELLDLQQRTNADELIVTTMVHDPADRLRSYELLAEAFADAEPARAA